MATRRGVSPRHRAVVLSPACGRAIRDRNAALFGDRFQRWYSWHVYRVDFESKPVCSLKYAHTEHEVAFTGLHRRKIDERVPVITHPLRNRCGPSCIGEWC